MNEKLVDGLKRRFETIEKAQFRGNQHIAYVEYFTFILQNPLTTTTAKGLLLQEGHFLNKNLLSYLFATSVLTDNYSLILKEIDYIQSYIQETLDEKKKGKGIKLTEKDVRSIAERNNQKTNELEKETDLNLLNVFHHKLIDRLHGMVIKIPLTFSKLRGIALASDPSKFYKPANGSDRLEYLSKIIQKKGISILSRDLSQNVGKKRHINQMIIVSTAIKNINETIKKKLVLKHNVILNNDRYMLNTEDYDYL